MQGRRGLIRSVRKNHKLLRTSSATSAGVTGVGGVIGWVGGVKADGSSYLSDVALRMEEDDVQLGSKKTCQRHRGAETNRHAHTRYPQRQVAGSAAFPSQLTIFDFIS